MDAAELIDRLGGTFAVAKLAGVKPPSVSEWKANNKIPDGKLIRLAPVASERGIATRQELFPDDWNLIWPELALKSAAADPSAESEAGQPVLVIDKKKG